MESPPVMDFSTVSLVDMEMLAEMQAQKLSLRYVHVCKPEDFAKGHLPGAVNFWRSDYSDPDHVYPEMTASRPQIEEMLSLKGILPTDFLILYDDRSNVNSAKLWWILKRYGHGRMALLDGATAAWTGAGQALDTLDAVFPRSDYHFSGPEDLSLVASREEVRQALENEGIILLDARSVEEYEGQVQNPGAARAGRIPGAVQIDYVDNMRADDLHFLKKVPELLEMYQHEKGIDPHKLVITYCQSAARSALTTFVLTEMLGYQQVKNYDGSWIEWSREADLPIETGPIQAIKTEL